MRNEYKMLEALGIRKKHKNLLVAGEYCSIAFLSVITGSIAGMIASKGIKHLSAKILRMDEIRVVDNGVPLRLTLIISIILFFGVFVVCYALISDLGMDHVISMGRGGGKTFRVSPIKIIFGVLFTVGSFLSLFMYWGKVNKAVPLAVAGLGMLFLMTSLVGIWLGKVKKGRNYYRKMLWLEQWYDRFYYNTNLSVVIAEFILIILFFFGLKVCDQYPVIEEKEYPYDLVWMANREDREFINGLKEKYGAKVQMREFIRVTTPDFSENMGISESAYEEWTGEKPELSGDEIFVVYQRTREQRSLLGIDYGAGRPRLYLGSAKYELWLDITPDKPIAAAGFGKRYLKKGEEDRILTGVFESRALPKYKAGVWENIIVFSDEAYAEFDKNRKGADLAVLINDSANQNSEEMRKEISLYAKVHSQVNFLDSEKGPLIYEKTEELLKIQKDQILCLASMAINIVIVMLCIIFILWTKEKCDHAELEWKYEFFTQSGMSGCQRKKNFRKEIFLSSVISVLGGMPAAVVFVIADVLQKRLDMQYNLRYLAELSGIAAAVITVILAFTEMIVLAAGRRIRKEAAR